MGCIEPQEEPGNCHVCGMKLVEVEDVSSESSIHISSRESSKNFTAQNKHHCHRAEDFLNKFWLSLILTIPIILYSDVFQKFTGIKLPSFEGIQYLILILGSIIFFYGGFVFLVGAYREIKAKNSGMMTLIGLAISCAYVYSVFAVLFKIGREFFWELTSLITIMLLGHYFEMRSVSSAQRALQEIEKLLPDIAERIIMSRTVTNHSRTSANKNKEILYKDLSYKIVGLLFKIKRELGLGHKEKIYANAFEIELKNSGINFEREKEIQLIYNDNVVGKYKPNFIIEDKVIIEFKALPLVTKRDKKQIWHYLRGTKYTLALLVNFGKKDVEIYRIVHSNKGTHPSNDIYVSSQNGSHISSQDRSQEFATENNVRNSSRESSQEFATEIIKLEELKVGDIVLVRPGGKIPTDGVVIEGKSEVNESMITGESKPVLKEIGSEVIAGTINGDGMLKIKVTKIGEETFLAGIKRLIKEAQASKSKLQVLADVFAKYLTFIAIFIGLLSFTLWLLVKKDFAFALERLVTILIIACPHALGLAIPLVVAISTSLAIHNGFLIRNRLQLELARKIDIVLFDKTGTLTSGKFKVKKILTQISSREGSHISSREGSQELTILQLAASLSQYSSHFISQGILEKAKEVSRELSQILPQTDANINGLEFLKVEDFENLPGRGVKGRIGGKLYYLGGDNLLKELGIEKPQITINNNVRNSSQESSQDRSQEFATDIVGTIVYLIEEKNILGAIILEDEIRKESFEAVKGLHKLGVRVLMITGDKKEIAEKVSKELEIDEYFAEVLPEDKVNKVKELQKRGFKVMMVGDGINDAPALMQADVGVAIGAGTNVAIESAGIILVKNDPRDIIKIIELSRKTYQKMIENLFWATGYNIVALPLAAGILAFKGILLSPALGAIFMSLSTIIVALNALRLS